MKSWYTIRARTSGTEVLIYDEIGAYGVTAKGFLAELGALPDDAVAAFVIDEIALPACTRILLAQTQV